MTAALRCTLTEQLAAVRVALLRLGEPAEPQGRDELDVIAHREAMEAFWRTRSSLYERARALTEALEREAAGTLGVCVDCRKRIAPGRLKVMPFAPRCLKCQAVLEQLGTDA